MLNWQCKPIWTVSMHYTKMIPGMIIIKKNLCIKVIGAGKLVR